MVIGDMIGVYGAWFTGHRDLLYVDVYKTGYGRLYLGIDKWILKRSAKTVFCRSPVLADQLKAVGIDARAAGNVMMDTIPRTGMIVPRRRALGLTLLPGSRAHTLESFTLQAQALTLIPPDMRPDTFVAVAPSVDEAQLRAVAPGLDLTFVPGKALGDVLDASDFVMSQTGTAAIQSIGLGKPAIAYRRPEERLSRFRDESRLFGDARIAVAADPADIAKALTMLITDPAERIRRAKLGRDRIGPPGAIKAIIEELLK